MLVQHGAGGSLEKLLGSCLDHAGAGLRAEGSPTHLGSPAPRQDWVVIGGGRLESEFERRLEVGACIAAEIRSQLFHQMGRVIAIVYY